MPRSIFMGRPWPQPGEPLFTQEDTDWALALAEEDRETCPSCGMPKAWCRDPANQFAFDTDESVCWSTYRLALFRDSDKFAGHDDPTRAAMQLSAKFRDGHEPDMGAGLDLPDGEVD